MDENALLYGVHRQSYGWERAIDLEVMRARPTLTTPGWRSLTLRDRMPSEYVRWSGRRVKQSHQGAQAVIITRERVRPRLDHGRPVSRW